MPRSNQPPACRSTTGVPLSTVAKGRIRVLDCCRRPVHGVGLMIRRSDDAQGLRTEMVELSTDAAGEASLADLDLRALYDLTLTLPDDRLDLPANLAGHALLLGGLCVQVPRAWSLRIRVFTRSGEIAQGATVAYGEPGTTDRTIEVTDANGEVELRRLSPSPLLVAVGLTLDEALGTSDPIHVIPGLEVLTLVAK